LLIPGFGIIIGKERCMEADLCFEMLFPGLSPEEKIEAAADAGWKPVEFWGWPDKNDSRIAETCRRRGVRVVNFSGHRRGSPVAAETHGIFLEELRDASRAAADLECPTLMVLSNELGDGGCVRETWDGIPAAGKLENFARVLERAFAESLPRDMGLVVEPLNTRKDHPGNFLSDLATAERLREMVGNPRLRILADFYHLAWMGEDPVSLAERYAASIGHVHAAGFPGRREPRPGGGDLDWRGVFAALRRGGYDGMVGFEYAPGKDSAESVRETLGFWEAASR